MSGTYDLRLVALSMAVAIMASYTALELAGRVSTRAGSTGARAWLFGGALAMGCGIWSMHFVGMLAFHLPIPVAYDAAATLQSMVLAVAVSGVALYVVGRPTATLQNVATGAMLMGLGIAAMHYTGMAAMRMSPAIEYDTALFLASLAIAVGASLAALWMAFKLRHRRSGLAILAKLGSAGVMGLAIAGMHYTGMAAARFAPDSVCLAADSSSGMSNAALATAIGIATFLLLSVTLVISAVDAQLAARSARLADSLQSANEQLRNIALYDAMTRLPNRMLLEDRLGQAISRATRNRKLFALMFVDLDRFKPVNDKFGHGVGDELLRQVASRLSACVRGADTVARVGGDEFVIVLGEIGAPKDAAIVGDKVLGELSRTFFVESHAVNISCSIGVSVFPTDASDPTELMVKADAAMYGAKRDGKNGVRFFVPGMTAGAAGGPAAGA